MTAQMLSFKKHEKYFFRKQWKIGCYVHLGELYTK